LAHTKHLEISSVRLFRGEEKTPETEVELMEAFEYKPNEFYVLRTADRVKSGKYIMAFEFNGNLTKGIVGFYKSVYTNSNGEKVPIATSKFQPTYARRAFPCFDEPSFKSTFATTLVRYDQT
jgi:aminopeptidase N